MNNFGEFLKSHLSNWPLVWFGFLFWGSIFSAFLLLFFNNIDQVLIYLIGYSLGIVFGLISKFKKWSWIN